MMRCYRCRTVTRVVVNDGAGKSAPRLCRQCYEGGERRREFDRQHEQRRRASVPQQFR